MYITAIFFWSDVQSRVALQFDSTYLRGELCLGSLLPKRWDHLVLWVTSTLITCLKRCPGSGHCHDRISLCVSREQSLLSSFKAEHTSSTTFTSSADGTWSAQHHGGHDVPFPLPFSTFTRWLLLQKEVHPAPFVGSLLSVYVLSPQICSWNTFWPRL